MLGPVNLIDYRFVLQTHRQPPYADGGRANCYDTSTLPNPLFSYSNYSYSGCIAECKAAFVIRACGCRDFRQPGTLWSWISSLWVNFNLLLTLLQHWMGHIFVHWRKWENAHRQHWVTISFLLSLTKLFDFFYSSIRTLAGFFNAVVKLKLTLSVEEAL